MDKNLFMIYFKMMNVVVFSILMYFFLVYGVKLSFDLYGNFLIYVFYFMVFFGNMVVVLLVLMFFFDFISFVLYLLCVLMLVGEWLYS